MRAKLWYLLLQNSAASSFFFLHFALLMMIISFVFLRDTMLGCCGFWDCSLIDLGVGLSLLLSLALALFLSLSLHAPSCSSMLSLSLALVCFAVSLSYFPFFGRGKERGMEERDWVRKGEREREINWLTTLNDWHCYDWLIVVTDCCDWLTFCD